MDGGRRVESGRWKVGGGSLLTYSRTHVLTYSRTNALTYSRTNVLTYSRTHVLTDVSTLSKSL